MTGRLSEREKYTYPGLNFTQNTSYTKSKCYRSQTSTKKGPYSCLVMSVRNWDAAVSLCAPDVNKHGRFSESSLAVEGAGIGKWADLPQEGGGVQCIEADGERPYSERTKISPTVQPTSATCPVLSSPVLSCPALGSFQGHQYAFSLKSFSLYVRQYNDPTTPLLSSQLRSIARHTQAFIVNYLLLGKALMAFRR